MSSKTFQEPQRVQKEVLIELSIIGKIAILLLLQESLETDQLVYLVEDHQDSNLLEAMCLGLVLWKSLNRDLLMSGKTSIELLLKLISTILDVLPVLNSRMQFLRIESTWLERNLRNFKAYLVKKEVIWLITINFLSN